MFDLPQVISANQGTISRKQKQKICPFESTCNCHHTTSLIYIIHHEHKHSPFYFLNKKDSVICYNLNCRIS